MARVKSMQRDGMNIVQLHRISKYYEMNGDHIVKALDDVDLTIERGKFQAVVGTSGSGKSTFLHILGGPDYASEGDIRFFSGDDSSGSFDLTEMSHEELTRFPWILWMK